MRITFLGAARSVTGSMHLLEADNRRLLLDCGLFQGKRKEAFLRNREIRFDGMDLDAVLLTHAHIDHSGNLPSLIKRGFAGTIYATGATADLCGIMLPDSGHLQERDVEFVNKKRRREGKTPFEPLYTAEEARATPPYFQQVSYEQPFRLNGSLEVVYHEAGHMLGAAMIEIRVKEGMGRHRTIVYTGDIGRPGQPILRDPWFPGPVDFLIMESTYGGRSHEGPDRLREKLLRVLARAIATKGKVVIPAFSVGRTQTLVYMLHKLWLEGVLPPLEIFVDSPLSVNATEVFRRHPECYDPEMLEFLSRDQDPFGLSLLTYVRDLEDSKKLNRHPGPCVIISASGMCEGGRILHHLAHTVGDPRNTILIIGFQAENTLGRRLVERAMPIRIFGEEYDLKAEVVTINAFSAHADQGELLAWFEKGGCKAGKIFLVHGEDQATSALAGLLAQRGFHNVAIPDPSQRWEL
jgi:metallo-beta-lactamase family protein